MEAAVAKKLHIVKDVDKIILYIDTILKHSFTFLRIDNYLFDYILEHP